MAACHLPSPFAPSRWTRLRSVLALATCLSAVVMVLPRTGSAQSSPEIMNGMPQQVIPQADEVGLGGFSQTTGTVTIAGSGNTSTGGGTSSGGGVVSTDDNAALDLMASNSWGMQAEQNAQTIGVTASALAGTCMVESQCGSNTGTRGDDFQMDAATFNQEITRALAANPSLAGSIVAGQNGMYDPATESIAAAQYLKDGALYLEKQGVANPTVLDDRSYYNFGPADGANVALAPDSVLMSDTLQHTSAANQKSNGIYPGETVGQWRAAVSAKLGGTANDPILS